MQEDMNIRKCEYRTVEKGVTIYKIKVKDLSTIDTDESLTVGFGESMRQYSGMYIYVDEQQCYSSDYKIYQMVDCEYQYVNRHWNWDTLWLEMDTKEPIKIIIKVEEQVPVDDEF